MSKVSPSSVIVLMMNGAIGVRANTVGVMADSHASRSARKASCCSAWVTTTMSRSLHASAVPEPIDPPTCTSLTLASDPSTDDGSVVEAAEPRVDDVEAGHHASISSVAVAGELVAAVAGAVLVGRASTSAIWAASSSMWNGRTRNASVPDWNENDAVLRAGGAEHDARRAHALVVVAADECRAP